LRTFFDQFGAKYSPDGKRISFLSNHPNRGDKVALAIFNATTGSKELEWIFEIGESFEMEKAQFSHDGKKVISLAAGIDDLDDGIRILDAETGEQLFHLGRGNASTFFDFDLSMVDFHLLAVAYSPGGTTIKIWNYMTSDLLLCHELDGGPLRFARFSPDGQSFLLADDDLRPAVILDVLTGDEKLRLDEGYNEGAFSPCGTKLILLSDEGDLWDTSTGDKIFGFGPATAAGFSPDGKIVFTASTCDHQLRLWDAVSGEILHEFKGGMPAFSLDGKFLATCEDHRVKIRLLESGEVVRELEFPESSVTSVRFRPDGKQVLVESRRHYERLAYHGVLISGYLPSSFTYDLS